MAGRQRTSKAGGTERQLSWSLSMASSCSLKAGRGPLEAETVWEEKMSLEVYRLLRVEPHYRLNTTLRLIGSLIMLWPSGPGVGSVWNAQELNPWPAGKRRKAGTMRKEGRKREKGLVIGPPPHDGFSKRETEAIMERWPLRPSFSCIKQGRGAPFLQGKGHQLAGPCSIRNRDWRFVLFLGLLAPERERERMTQE